VPREGIDDGSNSLRRIDSHYEAKLLASKTVTPLPAPDRSSRWVPFQLRRSAPGLNQLNATFGGGSGGLTLGLEYAVKSSLWRMESRKIILLVGDTSPTDETAKTCARTIYEAAQMDGILAAYAAQA